MKADRIVLMVAGTVALLALVFALMELQASRDAAALHASLVQRNARLASEVERWNRHGAEVERANAALRETLAGGPSAAVASMPSTVKSTPAANVLPPWKEAVQKDPHLQALHLEWQRFRMWQRYGAFFREAELTTNQSAEFSQAVMRYDERMMDLEGVAQSEGAALTDSAMATLKKAADDELRAAQLALLGDVRYRQLQEYDRTWWVNEMMTKVAGMLSVTETPITTGQRDELVRIVANASSSFRKGGKVDSPSDHMDAMNNPSWRGPLPDNFDSAAMFAQARAVLTERQFAFFGASVAQVITPKIFNLAQEFVQRRATETAPTTSRKPPPR